MGGLEDAAMEICRTFRLGANSKPELLSCYLRVVVCKVKTKSLCCFFCLTFDKIGERLSLEECDQETRCLQERK